MITLFVIGMVVVPLIGYLILRTISQPVTILYGLGLFASFISVNVHFGMTFYVTRIMLICLFMSITLRFTLNVRGGFSSRIDPRFIFLFFGILFVQLVGVILMTPNKADGFRQMFIYFSMMLIFLSILILGRQISDILKAIYFYLCFGIVQGCVGVYQVVGFMIGLPMYQDFLVGIPNGNPRNTMRVWWDGPAGVPRAFGFLADSNHYAGYLVGVILLSLALIVWNRRAIFPYIVLCASSAGLVFSLSRSGMVTLMLFGVPSLLFLLRYARFPIFFVRPLIKICFILILLRICIDPIFDYYPQINSLDPWHILTTRLHHLSEQDVTFQSHVSTRLAALDAFTQYPILGIGLATIWYSKSYDAYFGGSHSHHLDALGHTGIFGACLEWAFMGLVGLYLWRGLVCSLPLSQERAVMAGLLATFCAIFLGNFFYHYYLNDFVWFLMGCGVALSRNIRQNCHVEIKKQSVA